jgi:hypothetical protein
MNQCAMASLSLACERFNMNDGNEQCSQYHRTSTSHIIAPPPTPWIGSRQINALDMQQHQIKGDCSQEFVVEGAGWVHQNGGWQLAADVWLMFYEWDGHVECGMGGQVGAISSCMPSTQEFVGRILHECSCTLSYLLYCTLSHFQKNNCANANE